MKESVELIKDYPANVADMLINGDADISLLPVAAIPLLNEHHIISDYCIGSEGEVGSVCLFSEVPINDIKTVLLDHESRTSVELLKILLRDHWKVNPVCMNSSQGYEEQIKGSIAGLVIGDRAFKQRKKTGYIYDLGAAWKALTGLSFVFAVWVANKKLPEGFILNFNATSGEGFNHIPEIIAANPYEFYDLQKYYTDNISYSLDEKKRSGMKEFFKRSGMMIS